MKATLPFRVFCVIVGLQEQTESFLSPRGAKPRSTSTHLTLDPATDATQQLLSLESSSVKSITTALPELPELPVDGMSGLSAGIDQLLSSTLPKDTVDLSALKNQAGDLFGATSHEIETALHALRTEAVDTSSLVAAALEQAVRNAETTSSSLHVRGEDASSFVMNQVDGMAEKSHKMQEVLSDHFNHFPILQGQVQENAADLSFQISTAFANFDESFKEFVAQLDVATTVEKVQSVVQGVLASASHAATQVEIQGRTFAEEATRVLDLPSLQTGFPDMASLEGHVSQLAAQVTTKLAGMTAMCELGLSQSMEKSASVVAQMSASIEQMEASATEFTVSVLETVSSSSSQLSELDEKLQVVTTQVNDLASTVEMQFSQTSVDTMELLNRKLQAVDLTDILTRLHSMESALVTHAGVLSATIETVGGRNMETATRALTDFVASVEIMMQSVTESSSTMEQTAVMMSQTVVQVAEGVITDLAVQQFADETVASVAEVMSNIDAAAASVDPVVLGGSCLAFGFALGVTWPKAATSTPLDENGQCGSFQGSQVAYRESSILEEGLFQPETWSVPQVADQTCVDHNVDFFNDTVTSTGVEDTPIKNYDDDPTVLEDSTPNSSDEHIVALFQSEHNLSISLEDTSVECRPMVETFRDDHVYPSNATMMDTNVDSPAQSVVHTTADTGAPKIVSGVADEADTSTLSSHMHDDIVGLEQIFFAT